MYLGSSEADGSRAGPGLAYGSKEQQMGSEGTRRGTARAQAKWGDRKWEQFGTKC